MGGGTLSQNLENQAQGQPPVNAGQHADSVRKTPSLDQVKEVLHSAHVGITFSRELSAGYASGVLIQPSARMSHLLHPDEVLVLTASHIFSDWTDVAKVYGTLFTPAGSGRPMSRNEYSGRVIGRFIPQGQSGIHDTGSRKSVDVAFIALKVPPDDLGPVRERALQVASKSLSIQPGTRVFAAGSRGHEIRAVSRERTGRVVAEPNLRSGIVVHPNSEQEADACMTQYGPCNDHLLATTIQNEQGDSGGALCTFDQATGKLVVIGVCSSGGKRLGVFPDFPPALLGLNTDGMGLSQIQEAARKVLPEAESEFRGFFTGCDAISALEVVLELRLGQLERELAVLEDLYERHRADLEASGASLETIGAARRLHERAEASILKELHYLKPSR